jgi:hypothetical protein
MEDNIIKFAHDLIPLILNGTKVKTYRYDNKYRDIRLGATYKVIDKQTGEYVCDVVTIAKKYSTFGNLPLNDEGHEKYESREAMRKQFSIYYGKLIHDDEPMTIIEYIKK